MAYSWNHTLSAIRHKPAWGGAIEHNDRLCENSAHGSQAHHERDFVLSSLSKDSQLWFGIANSGLTRCGPHPGKNSVFPRLA